MTAFLFAFGADLVGLLYRGPYLEVVEFLPAARSGSIGFKCCIVATPGDWPRQAACLAAANLGKLVCACGVCLARRRLGGMTGMLLGFLASELVRYAITNGMLFRHMPAVWSRSARYVLSGRAFLSFGRLNELCSLAHALHS